MGLPGARDPRRGRGDFQCKLRLLRRRARPGSHRRLELFQNAVQLVRKDFVDRVDDNLLIKGAIEGMLSALNPHSEVLAKMRGAVDAPIR